MPWLTLSGSDYPCLERISMAPKMFEPLRFDYIYVFCGDVRLTWHRPLRWLNTYSKLGVVSAGRGFRELNKFKTPLLLLLLLLLLFLLWRYQGCSNEYAQSMFWAEIWKISDFLSENFHYLVVKFSVCLNRHVFVMSERNGEWTINNSKTILCDYNNLHTNKEL